MWAWFDKLERRINQVGPYSMICRDYVRPNLVGSGQRYADFFPSAVCLTKFGRCRQLWVVSTKFGLGSTNICRFRPNLSFVRQTSRFVRPKVVELGQVGLVPTNCGPFSARIGRIQPKVGLISTKRAHHAAALDLIWSCFDRLGSLSTNAGLYSSKFVQHMYTCLICKVFSLFLVKDL